MARGLPPPAGLKRRGEPLRDREDREPACAGLLPKPSNLGTVIREECWEGERGWGLASVKAPRS